MAVEGGCRCGAVRYTLDRDRLPLTYACHCHQCQRWSGSAFSQQAPVDEATISVTGPIEERQIVTDDRVSHQRFCASCGTRIFSTNSSRPGIAMLRAGTLDRSEELACVGHIFTATRQRWFPLPDGIAHWPDAPPADALMVLMRGDG